ncbi:MAG TPA: methyl-accepting chemotaxis protein, partial [Clostridiales bacterium]|nr:methyl-accepting chemotaxis protein [Clostridiales bacterium]
VSGVEKAANLVGNIATASNQQATGIAQINKGIEQVSQVVQTNSATAQESASASEELSSQAEMLKDLVSNFTLKKNPMYYKESDFAETNTNTNIAKSAVKKSTKIKKKIELDDSNFGKY